ncbi:MAG: hypothetical protein U1E15_13625 [Hyphomicrobiales bacterium]
MFYDLAEGSGAASFAKAVFVEDVACTPLRIAVKVGSAKGAAEKLLELPFACGE